MIRRSSYVRFAVVFALCLATGCRSADRRASESAELEITPELKTEIVEEFWPDGALKMRKHVLVEPDGARVDHGLQTLWYDDGQKEYAAVYDRGRIDGVETAWHRNGEKRTEQTYAHGLREGRRQSWDEKGRLRSEEFYRNDRPHGEWTIWKGDGSVKWRARFEDGQPVPQ